MTSWPLTFPALRRDGPARFVQIAEQLIDDIRRGRLKAGQRLPGTRAWARQLGVNRNTVVAAVAELVAQGWVRSTPTRGTWVEASLAHELTSHTKVTKTLSIALPTAHPFLGEREFTVDRGLKHISSGTPDPRLVPVDLLARAWRRVLQRRGRRLLEYANPAGHLPLREALAQMLSSLRGIAVSAENVLVTRGSQQALDLLARTMLRPGDVVAVEALGYRPAWEALQLAGATLVPIAVDAEGLDTGALDRLLTRRRVRAVYVTPHHQYPTTVTMSATRRLELLSLARRHGVLVIEDDYDHEFHYEGQPVRPLLASDEAGVVVYLGTLSKVLAPGLRLGFIVAPTALLERLSRLRAIADRQGDHSLEAAVAELIDDGSLQRHVRRMRVTYQRRRDALVESLRQAFGARVEFTVPAGGMALWVRAPGVSMERWRRAALARGVSFSPGARYSFDLREPGALRLVFASSTERELKQIVEVLCSTMPEPVADKRTPRPTASRKT